MTGVLDTVLQKPAVVAVSTTHSSHVSSAGKLLDVSIPKTDNRSRQNRTVWHRLLCYCNSQEQQTATSTCLYDTTCKH